MADTKKTKHYQKVPSAPLQEFMDMHNFTPNMMADALHQSGGGTISHWIRTGSMPGLAGVALEGLKRRMGKGEHKFFLLTMPAEKAGTALTVINSLGGKCKEIEI